MNGECIFSLSLLLSLEMREGVGFLASPLGWHKRRQRQKCLSAPASVADGFTPLVMGLGNVGGKTHDHRKVCKRTDYRCSTSPGGIQVVDLYFPKGGTTAKMIE
jgi:hypothetical protein